MPVQEFKRAGAVDRVRAVEELDGRAVTDTEFVVETADLGLFVRHPFVGRNAVVMTALYH